MKSSSNQMFYSINRKNQFLKIIFKPLETSLIGKSLDSILIAQTLDENLINFHKSCEFFVKFLGI